MTQQNDELYVFYHIAAINNWKHMVQEQVDILYNHGLAYHAKAMYSCILGNYTEDDLAILKDIQILDRSNNLNLYEQFTLRRLKAHCKLHPNSKILYFHTKGIVNHSNSYNVYCWRKYMEYFNIERWRDCIKTLDTHDACGVNWTYMNNSAKEFRETWHVPKKYPVKHHFSGNFWWVRADFMNKLDDKCFLLRPLLPNGEEHLETRHDAEFFFEYQSINAKPRIKCFHRSRTNLYETAYEPTKYRQTHYHNNRMSLFKIFGNDLTCAIINSNDCNMIIDILSQINFKTVYLVNCDIIIDKKKHYNNHVVLLPSINELEDESIDWLYIDKTNSNITYDITKVYDKIKYGGWCCGSNFETHKQNLTTLTKKMNTGIHHTENDQTWSFYKQDISIITQKHLVGLLIIKNEDPRYVEEWVNHHLNLGVEEIIILNHASTIDIPKLQYCKIINLPDEPKQTYFYFKQLARMSSRWALVTDIDEFLISDQPLPKLLEDYNKFDGLAINWLCFGSSSHKTKQFPQTIGYTHRTPTDYPINRHVKCIIRPSSVKIISKTPHFFEETNTVNENYIKLTSPFQTFTNDRIRINHYILRSEEDYKEKMMKSHVDLSAIRGWEEFHETNKVCICESNPLRLGIYDTVN